MTSDPLSVPRETFFPFLVRGTLMGGLLSPLSSGSRLVLGQTIPTIFVSGLFRIYRPGIVRIVLPMPKSLLTKALPED